jgi:hypothetical protein
MVRGELWRKRILAFLKKFVIGANGALILKPNMVQPGSVSPERLVVAAAPEFTRSVLRRVLRAEVSGLAFLLAVLAIRLSELGGESGPRIHSDGVARFSASRIQVRSPNAT